MLKLRLADIEAIAGAAKRIHELEAVKERVDTTTVDLAAPSAQNPLGLEFSVRVEIPKEYARAKLDEKIAECHLHLRALGIELET